MTPLLAALTALWFAVTTDQRPLEKATVSGVVVDAESGDGLPFAFVGVSTGASGSVHWTLADAGGRFTLAEVPAGSYYLGAIKPAYVPGFHGAAEPGDPGRRFELSAGQAVAGLSVRLMRGAVISGRIVDEYGDSAPGVLVIARGKRPQWRAPPFDLQWQPTPYTNNRGEFRIYGLPANEYIVAALSHDVCRGAKADEGRCHVAFYFPGTTDTLGAVPIALRAGEERGGVNLTLVRTQVFEVSGRLVKPPEHGQVTAVLGLVHHDTTFGDAVPRSSSSYPDGSFSYRVPAGQYWMTAAMETLATGPDGARKRRWFWALAPVTVHDRAVTDVTLTAHPAMDLLGVVKTTAGTAVERIGALTVALEPQPGSITLTGLNTQVPVGAEGRFALQSGPGVFRIVVRDAGHPLGPPLTIDSVRLGDRDVPQGIVAVAEGVNIRDLVVVVVRDQR
jgi:hypothetical protein